MKLTKESQSTEVAVPDEWREAVQEFVDRCEQGSVRSRYTYAKFKALLAADELTQFIRQVEPVGRVVTVGGYPDESEHTVEWLCKYKDLKDGDLIYTKPQMAEQQTVVSALVDVLEELVELVEDYRQGEYIIDSLTTQPARIALDTYREQRG